MDIVAFEGVAGQMVTLAAVAAKIGSSLDPVLSLTTADGTTTLATNDDESISPDSSLTYTLLTDGRYLAQVASAEPLAWGAAYTYTLSLCVAGACPPPTCAPAPDAAEPDDAPDPARRLAVDGTPLRRTFHHGADEDRAALMASSGMTYTILAVGKPTGVQLTLFAPDGLTPLVEAHPAPGQQLTMLAWNAPADGVYQLRSQPAPAEPLGCVTAYTQTVSAADDHAPTGTIRSEPDVLLSLPRRSSRQQSSAATQMAVGTQAWRPFKSATTKGFSLHPGGRPALRLPGN